MFTHWATLSSPHTDCYFGMFTSLNSFLILCVAMISFNCPGFIRVPSSLALSWSVLYCNAISFFIWMILCSTFCFWLFVDPEGLPPFSRCFSIRSSSSVPVLVVASWLSHVRSEIELQIEGFLSTCILKIVGSLVGFSLSLFLFLNQVYKELIMSQVNQLKPFWFSSSRVLINLCGILPLFSCSFLWIVLHKFNKQLFLFCLTSYWASETSLFFIDGIFQVKVES